MSEPKRFTATSDDYVRGFEDAMKFAAGVLTDEAVPSDYRPAFNVMAEYLIGRIDSRRRFQDFERRLEEMISRKPPETIANTSISAVGMLEQS